MPFFFSARRLAAARKMKQLRGEDPDNDNNEPNDDDLLAEIAPGALRPGISEEMYLTI